MHSSSSDCVGVVRHLGRLQQRQGIATRLIAEVENRAAARGFASLEFSYISPLKHLEDFYRKLGYELTGVVDKPAGDGWLREEWRGKVTFPHMAKSLPRTEKKL